MPYDLSIVQLRMTHAQFIATNPTPLDGQLCVETDTTIRKVGNGTNRYALLPAITLSGAEQEQADAVWSNTELCTNTRPKIFRVSLAQSSTDDPSAEEMMNTTGVGGVIERASQGMYSVILTGHNLEIAEPRITNAYMILDDENHYQIAMTAIGSTLNIRTYHVQSSALVDDVLGNVFTNILTIEIPN